MLPRPGELPIRSRAGSARNRPGRAEVSFMDGSLSMGSERPTSQCRGRTAALTKGRCRGPWHRSPTGNADAFPGRLMASGVAGQPARPDLPPGDVGVPDRTDVVDVAQRRIPQREKAYSRETRGR